MHVRTVAQNSVWVGACQSRSYVRGVTGCRGILAAYLTCLDIRGCASSATLNCMMHLVLECAAMADLCGYFPDIFQAHQTMQHFMWQPNLSQVAEFSDACMIALQAIDPVEWSNI